MAKKKECPTCKMSAEWAAQAENEVKSLQEKMAGYRSMVEESVDARGQLLRTNMELEREQHRLELIKLIVAGKKAEAVEYLLTAKPMLFSIDVRYADSATEIAAKRERANTCAAMAADAVRTALMPKEDAAAAAQ